MFCIKCSVPNTSHMNQRETEIMAKKFNGLEGETARDRGGGASDKSSNDVR